MSYRSAFADSAFVFITDMEKYLFSGDRTNHADSFASVSFDVHHSRSSPLCLFVIDALYSNEMCHSYSSADINHPFAVIEHLSSFVDLSCTVHFLHHMCRFHGTSFIFGASACSCFLRGSLSFLSDIRHWCVSAFSYFHLLLTERMCINRIV
ncbi:MAG: hypothetical protein IJC98_00420 [Clostridia bacterium]|nr:hypothetical protein [Clostridia bacterium]